MTEQNQTPDTADDAEGRNRMRDDAHRDDTEGHARARGTDDMHRDDDTQGHFRRDDDDKDDVEGHARRL